MCVIVRNSQGNDKFAKPVQVHAHESGLCYMKCPECGILILSNTCFMGYEECACGAILDPKYEAPEWRPAE